jgi:hypothetical protein
MSVGAETKAILCSSVAEVKSGSKARMSCSRDAFGPMLLKASADVDMKI